MRISADPFDPGYTADAGLYEITIDDIRARVGMICAPNLGDRVLVTADSDTGTVVYHQRLTDGTYLPGLDGRSIATFTGFARVTITPPPGLDKPRPVQAADDYPVIHARLREIEAENAAKGLS